jgi:hypothetical protein
MSAHATNANNRGPPVTTITLIAPFLDEELSVHRSTLLYNAPDLKSQSDQGLNSAIIQMAKAVSDQAQEAHSARLAREIAKDQPTLPSTKFSSLFTTLLALLNVREEAELPDFWFSLSAASKKQEFSIIRESLDAFSRSDQAYVNTPPIPTPKLVSDLTTLTFVGDHIDDLKTGIQPFMVMDGSEHYRSAAQELARNYNLLSERINLKSLKNFAPILLHSLN